MKRCRYCGERFRAKPRQPDTTKADECNVFVDADESEGGDFLVRAEVSVVLECSACGEAVKTIEAAGGDWLDVSGEEERLTEHIIRECKHARENRAHWTWNEEESDWEAGHEALEDIIGRYFRGGCTDLRVRADGTFRMEYDLYCHCGEDLIGGFIDGGPYDEDE
jgi:hypothetical protein